MVNYLCLPPPTYRPPNGQVCMISGWGLHSGVDGPGGEIRTDENRECMKWLIDANTVIFLIDNLKPSGTSLLSKYILNTALCHKKHLS